MILFYSTCKMTSCLILQLLLTLTLVFNVAVDSMIVFSFLHFYIISSVQISVKFFLHPWSSVLSQGSRLLLVVLYSSVSVELLGFKNLQPGLSLFQKYFYRNLFRQLFLYQLLSSSGIQSYLPSIYIILPTVTSISVLFHCIPSVRWRGSCQNLLVHFSLFPQGTSLLLTL